MAGREPRDWTLAPTGTGYGEPEKSEFPAPPPLAPMEAALQEFPSCAHFTSSLHLASHSQPPLHVTTQWMPTVSAVQRAVNSAQRSMCPSHRHPRKNLQKLFCSASGNAERTRKAERLPRTTQQGCGSAESPGQPGLSWGPAAIRRTLFPIAVIGLGMGTVQPAFLPNTMEGSYIFLSISVWSKQVKEFFENQGNERGLGNTLNFIWTHRFL